MMSWQILSGLMLWMMMRTAGWTNYIEPTGLAVLQPMVSTTVSVKAEQEPQSVDLPYREGRTMATSSPGEIEKLNIVEHEGLPGQR